MKLKVMSIGFAVFGCGVITWCLTSDPNPVQKDVGKTEVSDMRGTKDALGEVVAESSSSSAQDEKSADDSSDASPMSEAERQAATDEKAVEVFEGLTDKWMDSDNKRDVTIADIDQFVQTFKRVPSARRGECLQRALNLVPDENVMVLLGVLMDKTVEREYVEQVFNDVLNRDEDVKKPILQQIFKDKTHPCWADVAWILDATGELPKKGTNTVP